MKRLTLSDLNSPPKDRLKTTLPHGNNGFLNILRHEIEVKNHLS
jgi:hypothetical protein